MMMKTSLLIVALSALLIPAAAELVRVQTDVGSIVGNATDGDYAVFRGIPFAEPPLGALRWAAPKPHRGWKGDLMALTLSAGCPQECGLPMGTCPVLYSEDCLYLNIYAPAAALKDGKTRPVMVFFPGGNFRQSGASVLLYNAGFMANFTDTIIVTTNYRLGALGFLTTEQLGGNYGFMDQQLALRWVQANIANFGGDASRVTIFGQSAGAGSTSSHLVSPGSDGLFSRAIIESNPFSIEWKTVKKARAVGAKFAKALNCSAGDVDCLRAASPDQVVAAQLATKPPIFPDTIEAAYKWSITVGTPELPMQPLAAAQQGAFKKVPILLGTVAEEGREFIYVPAPKPVPDYEFAGALLGIFHQWGPAIMEHYPIPSADRSDTRNQLSSIATDYTFRCSSRLAAQHYSQHTPTYVYYYEHALSFPAWTPFDFCNGHVCHGSELPILFHSDVHAEGFHYSAKEEVFSRQMMTYWTNFAAGRTDADGAILGLDNAPAWPQYNATAEAAMNLDVSPNLKVIQHKMDAICNSLWDKVGFLKY